MTFTRIEYIFLRLKKFKVQRFLIGRAPVESPELTEARLRWGTQRTGCRPSWKCVCLCERKRGRGINAASDRERKSAGKRESE